jgi:O-antigen ligase
LINYAADYERINESLTRSKAIPCPQADHIRFSLLLSLAFFATLHLWRQLQWSFRPTWGKIYAFLAVWLVLGLHILSVRSGLLALYLGSVAWLGLWIVETKRWTLGLSLILVVLSLPFLAYFGVESFRAKIDLSLYNLQLYQQGTIGEYSDTQRFLSYKIALQLAAEKPWLGWGMGDVWAAQQAVYRQDYPGQNPMFPHNQFLSILVGTGVLGLLAFVGAWLWPLWRAWRQPLVLSFFVVMGSSFLTENTLFITIGVNIYVFFGLLFYAQPKEEIKSAKE